MKIPKDLKMETNRLFSLYKNTLLKVKFKANNVYFKEN